MNAQILAMQIAAAYRRVDTVARSLHLHLEAARLTDEWHQSMEGLFQDLEEAIAEVDRLEAWQSGAPARQAASSRLTDVKSSKSAFPRSDDRLAWN
jgi:hypothetical protein